jgi:hypothetical protein
MTPVSPRKAACDHVYRKFPDMKGTRPSVRKTGKNRVFTFEKVLQEGTGGPALKQIVKVTVTDVGRIEKVVASR